MQYILIGAAVVFRFLFKHLPALVVYIMTFLGISAVTYVGVSAMLSGVEVMLENQFSQLPSQVIYYLKQANVDVAITMVVSFKTFLATKGALRQFKTAYAIKHGGAP